MEGNGNGKGASEREREEEKEGESKRAGTAFICLIHFFALYSVVQKNSCCMFEFPAFLPPTNLGLPMHSPSALTEHVSLNLAMYFCLTLYTSDDLI